MLRVAVPNKGSLSEPAGRLLSEAGYRQRRDAKELVLVDERNETEFFFLRPRDIATYVGAGQLHAGITGRDLLLDSEAVAVEALPLGFGGAHLRYAARPGAIDDLARIDGQRVATSYVRLVEADLAGRNVSAEVIGLDGAVETAVRLGVADVVADVVETGVSMRQAGLEVVGEPILSSEAVLIRGDDASDDARFEQLRRRLNGVVIARQYVMLDYDIQVELLDEACGITPGLESPTVSPLHDQGWVAVRSMVLREDANSIMDRLWGLGGRGILSTDIVACRL